MNVFRTVFITKVIKNYIVTVRLFCSFQKKEGSLLFIKKGFDFERSMQEY